jgi:hypothetical protein
MKKEKLIELSDYIKRDPVIFLNFLKANYPLFHNSNFFFRDLQYGIKKYYEKKDIFISTPDAEELAEEISDYFEGKEFFIRINTQTWKVNFPEFVTQVPGDPL